MCQIQQQASSWPRLSNNIFALEGDVSAAELASGLNAADLELRKFDPQRSDKTSLARGKGQGVTRTGPLGAIAF